nr:unnamed protein product [Callosobruchus chinensis]
MIASKKCFAAKLIQIPDNSLEQVFVSIKLKDTVLVIGAVYTGIPPSSDLDKYNLHISAVEYAFDLYMDCAFLMLGDFNIPDAFWYNDSYGPNVICPDNSPAHSLLNCYGYHNLYQVNSVVNSRNVMLDLIFSSYPDIKVDEPVELIFPNCLHHSALTFDLELEPNEFLEYEESYQDFRNANYIGINDYLVSLNWDNILSDDVNVSLELFYKHLYYVIDMFVPLKRYKTSIYPCWFSFELKNTITCKKIAHKIFKLSGSLLDYEYFVQLRDKCARLKDVCYDRYIKKLEADISVNSKTFWKHVNAKKKCYTLPTEMSYVNESSSDIQGITDLFARYFASVSSNEDVNQIPEFKYSRQVDVNSYTVDVKTIIDMLSLGDKLIHGPDGIPLFFIKKCSFTLCKPLERLYEYNMSLSTGVFPDLWKESYLKPIYKNGSRSDIKNYRAVCNQSEFANLLDCIVNNLLSWDKKGVIIN